MKKIIVALANGFGLGNSPIASGTVGSLWGVLLVFLMKGLHQPLHYIVVCVVLACLAIPICSVAEGVYGKKDDGRIVADEYLTFPICMIGLPVSPGMLTFAFLTNRAFDILKPFPAHQAQRLKGGTGIVIDDVIAALYSLAANHLFHYLVRTYFSGS